jgi:predicted CoA-binding protein
MASVPPSIAAFLAGDPIAVAGVSRSGNTPANAIFRKLLASGHRVIPLNPNASEIEGLACFPDLGSVPGPVHAVMVVTHPSISASIARAAAERGVKHIWFHRSFGAGSVSAEAIQECHAYNVEPIVGGCPLMYCQPVDLAHRGFRWWLRLQHRIPG